MARMVGHEWHDCGHEWYDCGHEWWVTNGTNAVTNGRMAWIYRVAPRYQSSAFFIPGLMLLTMGSPPSRRRPGNEVGGVRADQGCAEGGTGRDSARGDPESPEAARREPVEGRSWD
ncbi:MAG: hypothetical protein ABIK79_09475 [Chloroflexota bacterium]